MSHFTVMVIGDDYEKLLAPFHEFECTGKDDEYIQDIDETERLREKYETETTDMIRLAGGGYAEPYEEMFWRPATALEYGNALDVYQAPKAFGAWVLEDGKKFRVERKGFLKNEFYEVKVQQLPAGAEEVTVTYSECKTFAEYIEYRTGRKVAKSMEALDFSEDHKYGYTLINEAGEVVKTINRTNPNAKWDWYSVGGRWSGMLKLNGEYREAFGHYEALLKRGKPIPDSLMAKLSKVNLGEKSWAMGDEEIEKFHVDSAPFGAIDWDGMMKDAGVLAGEKWDEAFEIHQGKLWVSWEQMREGNQAPAEGPTTVQLTIDGLRERYHGQENLKAFVTQLRERKGNLHLFFDLDSFLIPREQFVGKARDQAISTFAMIKEGDWIERGEMGWFGCVSNEKDAKKWSDEFKGLLEGIDPLTQITIVDCHI